MKRMNHRLFLVFTLVLTLAFLLASCATAGSAAPAESTTAAATAAETTAAPAETTAAAGIQKGTTFSYWINYDIPAYLPWMDNRGSALYFQIYDNLLYKYEGNKDDIRGNLAESWTVSDDGLVWTFQIKKDAYFTNGNQVTADAFVKTWDVTKEYQARYFAAVESYEATGEFELTVKLSGPSATFIYELPTQPNCGVVDPEGIAQYGKEDNRAAIGAGPYSVESYTSGQGFVLKANENYHNPDKAPAIETCKLVVIPDENTALIALLNGELDAMNTVNIEVYNNLVAQGWNVMEVEDRVNPFWFNAREVEIFRDPVVREALSHMVDWQAISDLVYDGKYPVSKSYWAGPGMVPYSEKYTYDPELGLKMLADAGYKPEDIDFTMLADPDFTNLEIAIQSQFQEHGLVNVKTVTYDGATCYGMLKGGTFEMFPVHNGYGTESPLTPFTMGYGEKSRQPVMFLDYIDKEKFAEGQALIEKANKAATFDEYLKEVEALTTLIQDQNLAMGGLQVVRFYAVNEKFTNIKIIPITGYIEFAYIRPAA